MLHRLVITRSVRLHKPQPTHPGVPGNAAGLGAPTRHRWPMARSRNNLARHTLAEVRAQGLLNAPSKSTRSARGIVPMTGDPKECRKHARNCLRLAEASTNTEITRTFVDLAHSWTRTRARSGKRPSSVSGGRGYGKCRLGRNGPRHDLEHSDAKKRASAQSGLIGRRSAFFRARAGREIPALRAATSFRLDGGD